MRKRRERVNRPKQERVLLIKAVQFIRFIPMTLSLPLSLFIILPLLCFLSLRKQGFKRRLSLSLSSLPSVQIFEFKNLGFKGLKNGRKYSHRERDRKREIETEREMKKESERGRKWKRRKRNRGKRSF